MTKRLERSYKKYIDDEKTWLFLSLNIIFQFFLINKPEISFIFCVPWIFFIFAFKLSFRQVILCTGIPGILVLLMYFCANKNDNLLSYLNQICDLNKLSTTYVSQKYDKNLSDFINLFIFNFQKHNNQIYQEFSNFGISYVITISGFHLGFLSNLLKFPLKKVGNVLERKSSFKHQESNMRAWNAISKAVVFMIVFFYWWSTKFVISGFRVLIIMLLKHNSKIVKWSQSVMITFLLFPYSVISYSFLLSFFIPMFFLLIDKYKNNKIVKNIYKQSSALIFSHVLLLPFINKIYVFSYINLIIFTPIIMFLFVYYLLFFWCGFLSQLHVFFYKCFSWSIKSLNINQHYLYINNFDTFQSSIIICVFVSLYLYYENKKGAFQSAI